MGNITKKINLDQSPYNMMDNPTDKPKGKMKKDYLVN